MLVIGWISSWQGKPGRDGLQAVGHEQGRVHHQGWVPEGNYDEDVSNYKYFLKVSKKLDAGQIEAVFERFDLNKDGRLSLGEFRKLMGKPWTDDKSMDAKV